MLHKNYKYHRHGEVVDKIFSEWGLLEDLQPGGRGVEVADAVVVGAASVQTVACARLQDVPILAQIIIVIIITIIIITL